MLEEAREEELREVRGVDHQETVAPLPPPDDRVRSRVADHLIRLRHEGCDMRLPTYVVTTTAAAAAATLSLHHPLSLGT